MKILWKESIDNNITRYGESDAEVLQLVMRVMKDSKNEVIIEDRTDNISYIFSGKNNSIYVEDGASVKGRESRLRLPYNRYLTNVISNIFANKSHLLEISGMEDLAANKVNESANPLYILA